MATEKRIAVITGANRGIGKEIARQLGQQGYTIIGTARSQAQADEVNAELSGEGIEVCFEIVDVANSEHRQKLVDVIANDYGRCDVLVNNAGVALDKWVPGLDTDLDILRQTMEVNVYAPLALSQLLMPLMRENNYGRVVNLSSELASMTSMAMAGTLAYRPSKAALNALTCLLALEVSEDNILINAAAPGWVATELGGFDAPRLPAEGADTPVWLATLEDDGPRAGFFRDREPLAW